MVRVRLPEPDWAPGRGCTTVIGDALHPTQPTLAQGGGMAIVRPRVLVLKKYLQPFSVKHRGAW